MIERFKCEKEIRDFFGGEVFKFQCLVEGIAEFETVKTMWHQEQMIDYRIELFIDHNSFLNYDTLDGLLEPMQIFRVSGIIEGSKWFNLYEHKVDDYKNN